MPGSLVEIEMKISNFRKDDILILKLTGRLDTETSPSLEERLEKDLETGDRNIILDLADVTFMSSQGLRVILTGAKRADAAGGKLVVCSAQGTVATVFKITGVYKILTICPAYPEAAAVFAE
jgi:anti-sigma B factor antagonist